MEESHCMNMNVANTQNMQGKVCLITGATSGMGKATAQGLARLGATVVLVARTLSKGEAVRDEIQRQSGNNKVDLLVADLSSQQEVRKLADDFKAKYAQLHVLVNNAGGVFYAREETIDGLERTFALDHLAYFLLTNLLLAVLKASAPARVINISSQAEAFGKINFEDLQSKKNYRAFVAYGQAKLANVMFTYELARRLEGTGITVNVVTPGAVATSFGHNTNGIFRYLWPIFTRFAPSAEQGAQTAIYLASSPDVEGMTGKVFYKSKELHSSKKSHNAAAQRRLWDISAEQTKLPVRV